MKHGNFMEQEQMRQLRAVEKTIGSLLMEVGALHIPVFQRCYSWGTEELEDYIDDAIQGEELFIANKGKIFKRHFIGSVVLAPAQKDKEYSILDGQQRVTTASIAIALLAELFKQAGNENCQWLRIKYLLQNNKKPKLFLQPDDKDDFNQLIENTHLFLKTELGHSKLWKAAKYINSRFEEVIREGQKNHFSNTEVLDWLSNRFIDTIDAVEIKTSSESEAFQVFETLNYRGLDLTAADLIKNKLFWKAGSDKLEDVRAEWQSLIESVRNSELVTFFKYYWNAFEVDDVPQKISQSDGNNKASSFVRKPELYDVYKEKIEDELTTPKAVLEFAKTLKKAAESYQLILDPKQTGIIGEDAAVSIKRLNTMRAKTWRPALLAGLVIGLNKQQIQKLCLIAESVTVRYSIVAGLNPNAIEIGFSKLARKVRQSPQKDVSDHLKDIEEFQNVPSDPQFKQLLETVSVESNSAWRAILESINQKLATGETDVAGPKRVHIEHILAQKPDDEARAEFGVSADENLKPWIYCFGNITLLSGPKNQSNQNKPFSKKRKCYKESLLAINHPIGMCKKWNKKIIEKRAKELASLASEIWKWPV
jgi:uncharacterized protein with ParB-like and HNH nuclease domain